MPLKKWDSAHILRVIRRYHREGLDLSYSAMARAHQDLVSAANYYHGAYREAVIAAGIDYERFRRKPGWDRARVVSVIRNAHRQRQLLNWSSVSSRGDKLGWAAKAAVRKRLFGNWDDALRAAGINPSSIRRYRPWTADAIVQELRSRKRLKQPLNSGAIQADLPGLYDAARRRFGSYAAALSRAGIDPPDVVQRRTWTRRSVCDALREFERSIGLVSQVMLREYDSGLLRAARICYGNLPAAIKAAGIRKYSVRGHLSAANRSGDGHPLARAKT